MSFLDFIFDNMFIVIIILFGLINFVSSIFKSGKKQSENTNKPPQHSSSKQHPDGRESSTIGGVFEKVAKQIEEKVEEYSNVFNEKEETAKKTLNQAKEEQYESLKDRLEEQGIVQGHEENHKAINKSVKHSRKTISKGSRTVGQMNVKRKITGKQLMDSFVMAEVLGPPRALKPYKSVTESRRNS